MHTNLFNKSKSGSQVDASVSFKELFSELYTRMVYFAFQIIGDKDSSEDIVQEAFIVYWNRKEELCDDKKAIKGFLYSTVKNACMNLLRHKIVVNKYSVNINPEPLDENNIFNRIVCAEVMGELYKAIDALPQSCQRISRMGYLEGKKNMEIAQELGISINTVKAQKQRALRLLRMLLKPEMLPVMLFFLHHKIQ